VGDLTRKENDWQDRATAAAITAARRLVCNHGPIGMATPIGRLSDTEWGWVVAAVIFAWIAVRAEQATAEGIDTERAARMTGYDPDPWDAGVIEATRAGELLPRLTDDPIDWRCKLCGHRERCWR